MPNWDIFTMPFWWYLKNDRIIFHISLFPHDTNDVYPPKWKAPIHVLVLEECLNNSTGYSRGGTMSYLTVTKKHSVVHFSRRIRSWQTPIPMPGGSVFILVVVIMNIRTQLRWPFPNTPTKIINEPRCYLRLETHLIKLLFFKTHIHWKFSGSMAASIFQYSVITLN